MSLTFGSVCSGIEAASVAWLPLGWRCAFMSEIEPFPRAVLAHHYPETPLHGDFTTIRAGDYEPIDVLVGGTPCQSFSVAGLRGGLDDDRGNLALEYLRLADRLRPRWLVWENVPGVLSSNGGRDFGAILGGLVELGYGFAYRVLDAQFFGLAQRRRRVFVVGYLGDWRRAAAVLFDATSLSGNPAPSREAGEGVAPTISSRPTDGGGLGTDFDCDGGLIAFGTKEFAQDAGNVAPPLRAMGSRKNHPNGGGQVAVAFAHQGGGTQTRLGFDPDAETAQTLGAHQTPAFAFAIQAGALRENAASGPDGVGVQADPAYTLEARAEVQAVAFALRGREGGAMPEVTGDQAGALRSASGGSTRDYVAFNITPSNSNKDYNARASDRAQAVTAGGNRPSARGGDLITGSAVRRLTPKECERLQGFADDFTLVPYRGKPAADGPRYKALGNSMAVPCMAWIGRRIADVNSIPAEA